MFTVTTPTNNAVIKLITAKSGKPSPSLKTSDMIYFDFHNKRKSKTPTAFSIRLQMDHLKPLLIIFIYLFMAVVVCEGVSGYVCACDGSDRRACLSVGVWFLSLAGSTQPCQFSFSGCLLLVCHWTCCVMLIKDLKGQAAFREWSTTDSQRDCEAPLGKPWACGSGLSVLIYGEIQIR